MRTKFAFVLLSCALLAPVCVNGQSPAWFQLTNGLPSTTRGDDIYFINQSTGWLARGANGIYKTTNAGNFWTKVTSGSSNYVTHFRSVSFATETHGWGGNLGAGAYDSTVTDTNNVLYETFDGGANWSPVTSLYTAGMRGFCTFHVLDSQHIYGAGRVRGPAYFVKSSDQGTNWTIVNLGTNGGLGIMGGIMDVYFHDTNNGFVVGMDTNAYNSSCSPTYYGRIARTTDGGSTWTTVATTTNGCCYFWKMAWPSTNIGYVSLQQNGSPMIGHVFYKTVDGGATWTPNVIPFSSIASGMTAFYWQGIGFVSTNEGWAGGSTTGISGSISNTFLHTTDGGATWSPIGFNNSQSINRLRILDSTLAYASGQKSYVYRIPVTITNQPQSQLVSTGANVTLTVGAAGNPSFTFQWQKNGTNLAGATDSSYSLNNVALSDSGSYSVSATNLWDGIASSNAVLTVYIPDSPPSISTQPQNVTTNEGQSATFTVTASGTAPLSYQWRFNTADIAGAISSGYTRSAAQFADAGSYTVLVTNVVGSVTSTVATLTVLPNPPSITTQPQSQTVSPGSNATFTVTAAGTTPLSYQWRFNSTNISGATNTSYTRANAQAADAGSYSVVVTNVANSVTSAVALLAIASATFSDDFDSYSSPITVTHAATTNGYKIFFGADSGAEDFNAIFGFDYSTVTFPTNIPPAPHSTGGTTKGLYLTVNKDVTAAAAGVNLYPAGQSVSGNFSLKFDLWLNWDVLGSSTEHALFGINHSASVTNRITQASSDGLFFAVDGDGNVAASNTSSRDFSVLRGGGGGAIPILMLTNNTTFGPTPPLAPRFDYSDPGFVSLFPSKTIPGFGSTPAGSAGLGWVTGEVRQENKLITCLLNGTVVAQYTNSFAYTNGTILIGYNDTFSSIGDSNCFGIFDNIRLEYITPVPILWPYMDGNSFSLSFATDPGLSYTVQRTTDLTTQNWQIYTNVTGDGNTNTVLVPLLLFTNSVNPQYFRISQP